MDRLISGSGIGYGLDNRYIRRVSGGPQPGKHQGVDPSRSRNGSGIPRGVQPRSWEEVHCGNDDEERELGSSTRKNEVETVEVWLQWIAGAEGQQGRSGGFPTVMVPVARRSLAD